MSTSFIFANIFNVTLQSPITSSGATTMTLSSTTNAPTITAGQNWVVALNDAATQTVYEIVYVTARTGAVCTILRGQEGTAATTWLAGDNVYAPDTAGILNNFALINGNSSQNFAANNITSAGTIAAGGQIATADNIVASQATGVSFFGVANTNVNNLNGIAWGNVAGGSNFTELGAGSNFFSTVNGVVPVVLGVKAAGTSNVFIAADASGNMGIGGAVVAIGSGSGTMFANVAATQGVLLIGSYATATKALSYGNASNETTIGSMGDAVNTISGTAFEVNAFGTALTTVDIATGSLGIVGTLHQTSRRELKQRIDYIDPDEALRIVLATKIARYDFVNEDKHESGNTRHASFIADETPWELSGGPGYEHADPQKTASYALAAIAGLAARVIALEAKG